MSGCLRFSVPQVLEAYKKGYETITEYPDFNDSEGIQVVKNVNGKIEYVCYYSDTNELLKKVFYEGTAIICIENYRNQKLVSKEEFKESKLVSKHIYGRLGEKRYEYSYNRQNRIDRIQKIYNNNVYKVAYTYDELGRVNGRKFYYNSELIDDQKFRFDILDRIVEYKDNNQRIIINKLGNNNELIYYTITDKMGNEISVVNFFNGNEYQKTEITLNLHTITVKDTSYVDNVMLKKPYTSEDDLDLVISNLFSKSSATTKRCRSDVSENVISENISVKALPISMRKRVLYNLALNA